jgi:CubicO group peptidase (beta-lactamase class C family)
MLAAIEEQALDVHSVMVIRNGTIVTEKYFPPHEQDTKHELYSVTKSFISALVGIAIQEGYIEGVHQPVVDLLSDWTIVNNDVSKQSMTLEHLLTMTSGLDWPESQGDAIFSHMWRSADWAEFVLGRTMLEEPGNQFNYCSGCSHVLSVIIQERTGMSTLEFAQTRLFEPLGIVGVAWDTDPNGTPIGGWGMSITPRDMAKLGYLYLNNGVWEGQQIVPVDWVSASTRSHIPVDEQLDYGYQWWIDPGDGYVARGRFGQLIFVIPDSKVVVVFTAGVPEDAPLLDLIHDYVIPAIQSP